jgi:hypothetical protein
MDDDENVVYIERQPLTQVSRLVSIKIVTQTNFGKIYKISQVLVKTILYSRLYSL